MSIKVKTLKKRNEIKTFAEGYFQSFNGKKLKAKHIIPIEEALKYDYIQGVFKDNELIGGYIINHFPSRCLETLPQNKQYQIIANLGGVQNTCEIAGIWRRKGIDAKDFAPAWGQMQKDVLKTRKKYIFGCCYKGNPMLKTYDILRPKIVHHGETDNELTIFYYTKKQYILTSLLKRFMDLKQFKLKTNTSWLIKTMKRI